MPKKDKKQPGPEPLLNDSNADEAASRELLASRVVELMQRVEQLEGQLQERAPLQRTSAASHSENGTERSDPGMVGNAAPSMMSTLDALTDAIESATATTSGSAPTPGGVADANAATATPPTSPPSSEPKMDALALKMSPMERDVFNAFKAKIKSHYENNTLVDVGDELVRLCPHLEQALMNALYAATMSETWWARVLAKTPHKTFLGAKWVNVRTAIAAVREEDMPQADEGRRLNAMSRAPEERTQAWAARIHATNARYELKVRALLKDASAPVRSELSRKLDGLEPEACQWAELVQHLEKAERIVSNDAASAAAAASPPQALVATSTPGGSAASAATPTRERPHTDDDDDNESYEHAHLARGAWRGRGGRGSSRGRGGSSTRGRGASNNNNGNGRRDKYPDRCGYCNKTGHSSTNCFSRQRDESNTGGYRLSVSNAPAQSKHANDNATEPGDDELALMVQHVVTTEWLERAHIRAEDWTNDPAATAHTAKALQAGPTTANRIKIWTFGADGRVREHTAVVDTGCTVTLVADTLLAGMRRSDHTVLAPRRIAIATADGNTLKVVGNARVCVGLGAPGNKCTFDAIVVHGLAESMLLGVDWLRGVSAHIDMSRNPTLSWGLARVPLTAAPSARDVAPARALAAAVSSADALIEQCLTSGLDDAGRKHAQTLRLILRHNIEALDPAAGAARRESLRKLSVELRPTAQLPPVRYAEARHLAQTQLEFLESDTLAKERAGMVRRVNSAAAVSPAFVVTSSSGKPRTVYNFRALNECVADDAAPLPDVTTTLRRAQELHGRKFFSSLDMLSGFCFASVTPESQKYLGFFVGGKTYVHTRVPMGLKTSPAFFHHLLVEVLGEEYGRCVVSYIDDLIIASNTEAEHIDDIRRVVAKLAAAGLPINPAKARFMRTEITFLGHRLSQHGVSPCTDKIEAMSAMPAPESKDQLRSLMGMLGFYQQHVKNFATIVAPMSDLLKQHARFVWGEEQERARKEVLKALVDAPLLSPSIPDGRFRLTTDASAVGVGAKLEQQQGAAWLPIAFYSRKLSDVERRYSATEREAVGLLAGLQRFDFFLRGRRFIVRTDHKPLVGMATSGIKADKYARMASTLCDYDIEYEYLKGEQNVVADALSRMPLPSEPPTVAANITTTSHTDTQAETASAFAGKSSDSAVARPKASAQIPADQIERLKYFQQRDEAGKLARAWLERKQMPNDDTHIGRSIKGIRKDLVLRDDGVIGKSVNLDDAPNSPYKRTFVVLLPDALFEEALGRLHDDPDGGGGHRGLDKTYEQVRARFWCVDLRERVQEYCRRCVACQSNKRDTRKPAGKMIVWHVDEPRKAWALDTVRGLPTSDGGHTCILVMKDMMSRWVELEALVAETADAVADAFVRRIVLKHGAPEIVLTDRGGPFIAELFNKVNEILAISKRCTTPYHPQTNAILERGNGDIKTMLTPWINQVTRTDWHKKLPFVEAALNNARHKVTGLTPFQLMTGQKFRVPLDQELGLLRPVSTASLSKSEREYLEEVRVSLEELYEKATERSIKASNASKVVYDQHRRPVTLKPGDFVRKRIMQHAAGVKPALMPRWDGPFRVVKVHPNNVVEITSPERPELVHRVNASQLKEIPEPAPPADSDVQKFEVEKILDERYFNGELEFLIKWRRFRKDDASWEPESTIRRDVPELVEDWVRARTAARPAQRDAAAASGGKATSSGKVQGRKAPGTPVAPPKSKPAAPSIAAPKNKPAAPSTAAPSSKPAAAPARPAPATNTAAPSRPGTVPDVSTSTSTDDAPASASSSSSSAGASTGRPTRTRVPTTRLLESLETADQAHAHLEEPAQSGADSFVGGE